MKLISTFLLAALLFTSLWSAAQREDNDPLFRKREYKQEVIDQLKATKTVFFYKRNDLPALDSFKQAISSAWTLTPLIFEEMSNFGKYADNPAYSYFIIEGLYDTYTMHSGYTMQNLSYYLTLRLFKEVTKKDKTINYGLCRIELSPDYYTFSYFSGGSTVSGTMDYIGKRGNFHNWTPVVLKADLTEVANNLKNLQRSSLFESKKADDLAHLLSGDTLFVPEQMLIDYGYPDYRQKEKNKELFQDFKFNYRICTDAEIYQIFETEKRGRFLFEYVKSSTEKYITIHDTKQGLAVYRKYGPMSLRLKSSDFEIIK